MRYQKLIEAARLFALALIEASREGVLDQLAGDMSGGPDQVNAMCDAIGEIANLPEGPDD